MRLPHVDNFVMQDINNFLKSEAEVISDFKIQASIDSLLNNDIRLVSGHSFEYDHSMFLEENY